MRWLRVADLTGLCLMTTCRVQRTLQGALTVAEERIVTVLLMWVYVLLSVVVVTCC
jgi:hypothetical protein